MRSTILALVSAGSITLIGLTPAFATGACAGYPDLRNCPIYGVYENSNSYEQPNAYQPESSYQRPYRTMRHARYHGGYYRHG
jgi:hypothetical protein